LSCRATNAIEVIGNEMNFSLAKHWINVLCFRTIEGGLLGGRCHSVS
jgi:hypothetical protein